MKKRKVTTIAALLSASLFLMNVPFSPGMMAASAETPAVSEEKQQLLIDYSIEELMAMTDEEIASFPDSEQYQAYYEVGNEYMCGNGEIASIMLHMNKAFDFEDAFYDYVQHTMPEYMDSDGVVVPGYTVERYEMSVERVADFLNIPSKCIERVEESGKMQISFTNDKGEYVTEDTSGLAIYFKIDCYGKENTKKLFALIQMKLFLEKFQNVVDIGYNYYGAGSSGSPSFEASLIGDVDLDGVVSLTDIVTFQKHLLSGREWSDVTVMLNADCNGDGNLDTVDISILTGYLCGKIKALPCKDIAE